MCILSAFSLRRFDDIHSLCPQYAPWYLITGTQADVCVDVDAGVIGICFSACLSRVPVERLPGRYMSRFLSILRSMIDILPSSQNTVIIFTYCCIMLRKRVLSLLWQAISTQNITSRYTITHTATVTCNSVTYLLIYCVERDYLMRWSRRFVRTRDRQVLQHR